MRRRPDVLTGPEALEPRDNPVIVNGAGFPPPLAVSGPDNGLVTLFPPIVSTGQFNAPPTAAEVVAPFGAIPAQVRTAFGDVNGDAIQDLIAVTGPGLAATGAVVPTRAVVLDGRDFRTPLVPVFDPFGDPNFTGGGFVAAGDIDGDRRAEFAFTPDVSGGPRVVIDSFPGTNAPAAATLRRSFLGIDDPAFRGGARPALGDLNGDGFADLSVAAGFGGGPRVAVYNGFTLLTTSGQPPRLVPDFFAFPGADTGTLRNGVFVASGDINGDGFADLVFGGGPGGGPRVLALSGAVLVASGADAAEAAPLANFFSGDPTSRGGVRVAAKPTGIGTRAEIVTGTGEFQASGVRAYYGVIPTAGEPTPFQAIDPYRQVLAGGVYVG